MTVQNTPNPSTPAPAALTVVMTVPYPSWCNGDDTGAVTNDTFDVSDVEIFVHGVSFPAGEGSANTLVPWHRVFDIHQAS
jgi:hypothetical protein